MGQPKKTQNQTKKTSFNQNLIFHSEIFSQFYISILFSRKWVPLYVTTLIKKIDSYHFISLLSYIFLREVNVWVN